MRSFRNEIKHIMIAVTVLATIFAMTLVLAGNASAVVTSPLGNPAVVHAPIGTAVSTLGVRPAINPFFRPAVFNPFFRPAFFNPFFGVDADLDFGLGFGFGIGDVDVGIGAAD